jgi:hypothetical protein
MMGPAKIFEMAEREERCGKRFQPTPMLRELAKTTGRFYDI